MKSNIMLFFGQAAKVNHHLIYLNWYRHIAGIKFLNIGLIKIQQKVLIQH